MDRAYYSEIDPYAAQWLRNLILCGEIADGDVDTRSIEDVRPDDLEGYTQCHFFAGLGGWSLALRLAGWADSRPVWTGSCPCQPFSQAGKGRGFADERHLWPVWHRLIAQRRPPVVFGEQVASPAARAWLAAVRSDVEAAGYAVGSGDLCAAGAGAPHIRQRIYWVADTDGRHTSAEGIQRGGQHGQQQEDGRVVDRLADDDDAGRSEHAQRDSTAPTGRSVSQRDNASGCGGSGELAHHQGVGRREERPLARRFIAGNSAQGWSAGFVPGVAIGELAFTRGRDAEQSARPGPGSGETQSAGAPGEPIGSGALGFWSGCEWIACRDNKLRPVEPGSFPLAHGAPARVGRLRAYGNAIVAPLAAEFIGAYLDD